MVPRVSIGISDKTMMVAGLLLVPSFLLQEVTVVRAAEALVFLVLAGLVGRRIRILPPVLITLSVVVAHLLVPNGRLLFEAGPVRITRGALLLGVDKAALLVGLVYLSRISIRPGLSLPGRAGRILGRVFFYFEELSSAWPETEGGLVARLDETLVFAYRKGAAASTSDREARQVTSVVGYLLVGLVLVAGWFLLVLGRVGLPA